MRLLLDANLSSQRIGDSLRRRRHDVRGAAVGLDERILITRNSRDFAPLCRLWAEAGREHAGVILVWSLSQRQYGEIIAGSERWLVEIPDDAAWRGVVASI